MDREERKRKRKAWIASAGIQVALLLLFYFLMAWQAPNPPNAEFGIELNFGLVNTGASNSLVTSQAPTEAVEANQMTQENTVQEIVESQEPTESQNPVETFETSDPDIVYEEPQERVSQQTEKNGQADQGHVSAINQSKGDTGENGNQGDPEGAINADAVYGTVGGGNNGFSLQLSGWEWDSPPVLNDVSQESGKIVYEIVLDADGYLTSYNILTSTISPSVVQRYTRAIQELDFSKTSSYQPAQTSKGKITFIIRAR